MRTVLRLGACSLWICGALLCGARPAQAIRVVQQDALILRAGEALDDELLVFSSSVEFDGTARDDLFLFANELRLGGTFESAMAAVGDKISLTGRVSRHARLLGNVVSLEGADIGAGALLIGTTVRVDDDTVLQGGARVLAQDAILRGQVHRGLRVRARRVRIGGEIGGDVEIFADDLVVLPGTRIHGDLVAYLPHPAVLDPRVVVDGQVMMGPAPASDDLWPRVLLRIYLYLAAALSLLPLIALFPRTTGRTAHRLRTTPWRCALCGAILFGAIPLMAGIGLVTIIGIPLAFILATGYVLLAWLAQGAAAVCIGARLRGPAVRDTFGGRAASLLLGLALLHLAIGLPVIGAGVAVAALLFGQGAWCLALYDGETRGRLPLAGSETPGAEMQDRDGRP